MLIGLVDVLLAYTVHTILNLPIVLCGLRDFVTSSANYDPQKHVHLSFFILRYLGTSGLQIYWNL